MKNKTCVSCGGHISSLAKEAVVRKWARKLSNQARYPVVYRLIAGISLCAECLEVLPVIGDLICQRCGREQGKDMSFDNLCHDCKIVQEETLVSNRSLLHYNDWGKNLLGLYKYRGDERLAVFYGGLLAVTFFRYHDPSSFVCITTVPLHNKRLYERGFNQVDLLVAELSRAIGVPVRTLLQRTKETAKLSKQGGRTARQDSMREAFAWVGDKELSTLHNSCHQPYKILLVDDIFTTGSTLRSCASVLRAHLGALCEIYSLTIYR
ncbi:amidophosphoribosyltransferase [Brevibacillus reuszeri]|uniref:Amidophosphoribosyltransferase n=1 Tax=Brevibacillus reuszeri TaxID=54915 RepID=A0A0K9YT73_9BACL|nr:ComF family protein [Brevibacillus reuszeri]KNB71886.1 amidophosphoribosyltransferase [Brevibacillus reuszeri]MED1855280.1 ComF family protein [Brevibacillus reuszeri]GED67569.1 amidophosphoribosyltransferase [Brevibacillus reuszeri]